MLQQLLRRQHFVYIQQEHGHLLPAVVQVGMQGLLVAAVSLPEQAFNAVAVYGFFKITAAGAYTEFYGKILIFGRQHINYLERKYRKRFSLAENLFKQLAAFQLFFFTICITLCVRTVFFCDEKSPISQDEA